jgi:hypothetical protein
MTPLTLLIMDVPRFHFTRPDAFAAAGSAYRDVHRRSGRRIRRCQNLVNHAIGFEKYLPVIKDTPGPAVLADGHPDPGIRKGCHKPSRCS